MKGEKFFLRVFGLLIGPETIFICSILGCGGIQIFASFYKIFIYDMRI